MSGLIKCDVILNKLINCCTHVQIFPRGFKTVNLFSYQTFVVYFYTRFVVDPSCAPRALNNVLKSANNYTVVWCKLYTNC